jgi:hypothetical protein
MVTLPVLAIVFGPRATYLSVGVQHRRRGVSAGWMIPIGFLARLIRQRQSESGGPFRTRSTSWSSASKPA